ncbi:MAG: hypothetical protein MPN21_16440 [Thermoanaerobaculia bacterium]|nr:hypothetical protein [Thermoanaerobaculia bacterium]
MTVAIIADSHLGGPGGDGDLFVEQLCALPEQGCTHLVLLGDIFHVWVGSRKFETSEVRKVVPELRALREAGVRVDYVEGNRDFFLRKSPYADCFDRLDLETHFEAGGESCLAVHGDGLNDRDRQYLFWRWLSKSTPVRWAVLGLPSVAAQKFVHGTEAKLSKTNFKHKRQIPEQPIRRYGERRLGSDPKGATHQHLFLGHFHEPHRFEIRGGTVHVLDAWFNSNRVEWPDRLIADLH